MKKLFIGAMLLAGMSAFAQETYQNAEIATEDLNGTARYVGMGGAMEALGADISTIGTNPAGIGMFRRSQVTLTGGIVSQPKAASSAYLDDTNASFDQAGFVWSQRVSDNRFLNFGFNYHKSANFNNILSASDKLNNASQNKLSYVKAYLNAIGVLPDNAYNQADYLYENAVLYDEDNDMYYYYDANKYDFAKVTTGYVGNYDFNISGNVSNRVYLGVTFGLKDVNYDSYTIYREEIGAAVSSAHGGSVTMTDHRRIEGSGFDIRLGAIVYPIEDSAFRLGLSIATPTWYDLTTANYTVLNNDIDPHMCDYGYDKGENTEDYDYRLNSPWKFGVSAAHTIGTQLALGLSYEFADYTHLNSRYLVDYGYVGDNRVRSRKDKEMCADTKLNLQGVHTLKLGAEYKVLPQLALRAGYNFVSAMYKTDAFRDGSVDSPGVYYSSTTDYTNWKATNRLTLGAGYSFGNFGVDVAYQYTTTSGDFSPFMSFTHEAGYDDEAYLDMSANAVSVKKDRHQFMATLSYKF